MSCVTNRNTAVILLAYAHRYLFPMLSVGLPLLFCQTENVLLYMGTGFVLFSLYSFAGYKLRWKHIFCSYQNAYHKKMTPDRINWNLIKKADAYGTPIIFGILGVSMILCYFVCL